MRWVAFVMATMWAVSNLEAGYTLKDGKLVNSVEVAKFSAEKHYKLAVEAFDASDFREAERNFNIIVKNFPTEAANYDAQFYLGVSQYNAKEYDLANDSFTAYLASQSNPRYFEDAIGYKLQIASQFHDGARKRFFGSRALPKWAPPGTLAVDTYNEVITALPCHDYAAQALYSKACLHWQEQDFRDSVEAFQTFIRRFPKHELTPNAYLSINRVYYNQAESEFQNPDLLALAEINQRKFERAFPKEERIEEGRSQVQAIKELYARGLFETAQFYERIEKPEAAAIYYQNAIQRFPDTGHARCSRYRLSVINPDSANDENVKPCRSSS